METDYSAFTEKTRICRFCETFPNKEEDSGIKNADSTTSIDLSHVVSSPPRPFDPKYAVFCNYLATGREKGQKVVLAMVDRTRLNPLAKGQPVVESYLNSELMEVARLRLLNEVSDSLFIFNIVSVESRFYGDKIARLAKTHPSNKSLNADKSLFSDMNKMRQFIPFGMTSDTQVITLFINSDRHWSFIYITNLFGVERSCIHILDGLGLHVDNPEIEEALNTWIYLLKVYFINANEKQKTSQYKRISTNDQKDGHSCGIIAIEHFNHFINSTVHTLSAENVNPLDVSLYLHQYEENLTSYLHIDQ